MFNITFVSCGLVALIMGPTGRLDKKSFPSYGFGPCWGRLGQGCGRLGQGCGPIKRVCGTKSKSFGC